MRSLGIDWHLRLDSSHVALGTSSGVRTDCWVPSTSIHIPQNIQLPPNLVLSIGGLEVGDPEWFPFCIQEPGVLILTPPGPKPPIEGSQKYRIAVSFFELVLLFADFKRTQQENHHLRTAIWGWASGPKETKDHS